MDGFSDDRLRRFYCSLTSQGRLVCGGGSNPAYLYRFGGRADGAATHHDGGYAAIQRQLAAYVDGAEKLSPFRKWSGALALTMSRVCSIGVRGEAKNVYYGLGYSGYGVVLSNLAGRVISDLYHGDHEQWKALPFHNRRLEWVPPEPMLGNQHLFDVLRRLPRNSVPRERKVGRRKDGGLPIVDVGVLHQG
jgi:glycine/D-amino acid oxidase-like deaminating enzyme